MIDARRLKAYYKAASLLFPVVFVTQKWLELQTAYVGDKTGKPIYLLPSEGELSNHTSSAFPLPAIFYIRTLLQNKVMKPMVQADLAYPENHDQHSSKKG